MKTSHMVFAAVVLSMSVFIGRASAEATLWGIYGDHSMHDCPVINRDTAKEVIALSKTDPGPLLKKYGVTEIVDQYHSGLEHTFLWAVKTTEPHKLEEFTIALGVARWNDLRFVPLRTFAEGVLEDVKSQHGLEDWEPRQLPDFDTSSRGGISEQSSAEATLWGIYGDHSMHDCPVINRETAKEVIAISKSNLAPLLKQYGITAIVDQYHSGLEHTFLWAVKTTEPHKLEEFTIALGVARWNDLKFVPLRTFAEGVLEDVKAQHGLEDWSPESTD